MVSRMKRFNKRVILAFIMVFTILITVLSAYQNTSYVNDYNKLKYNVTGAVKNLAYSETPVGKHGALSVKKTDEYTAPTIVDENGKPLQLRTASTHGVQWFPQYINKAGFQSLRDEWGINTVRLAIYPREGGYLQGNKTLMDKKIAEGVKAAKELGMYIIIDWHVLSYNPNEDIEAAKSFFKKYAALYKKYDNVIFEICNEPTGTPWYNDSNNDLYTYCKTVAKVIRDCGNNSIIICGTNDWSQRVDEVASKPLKNDGFENIMYSIHFYAATHYDNIKNNFNKAIEARTPVFASEFGCCDASGNGAYDFDNADDWMRLFKENNVSYACWSLCNKAESASYISSSCTKTSNWTASDLTQTGVWLINTSRSFAASEGISTSTVKKLEKPEFKSNTKSEKTSKEASKNNKALQNDVSEQESINEKTAKTESLDKSDSNGVCSIKTVSDWGAGLVANGVIANSGSSEINDWKLEFDFDGKITNLWCAKIVSHTGNHYVIKPEDYNKTIPADGEVTFGFCAEKNSSQTGSITNIKVK